MNELVINADGPDRDRAIEQFSPRKNSSRSFVSYVTLFFLSRVHDEFFILAATGAAAFDIYFYRFIESLALVNPIGDWFNIYFNNVHWIVKTEIQEVQLRYNN